MQHGKKERKKDRYAFCRLFAPLAVYGWRVQMDGIYCEIKEKEQESK